MMELPPEDLLIEAMYPRASGGQHVGTMNSGVRVTHLPTGTTAACDLSRSQHRNRQVALDMVLCALTHPLL